MRELNQSELTRDLASSGLSLDERGETRFALEGAHDPTSSRYFVLEQLFSYFDFDEHSHLLDVGCGVGRVLAYFVEAGFPGRATGVELDPALAQRAQRWSAHLRQLDVKQASVLDLDLGAYTDFYLFNPFDNHVLVSFIEKLEAEAERPVTVVHMSDNGDNYSYLGRPGWDLLAEGWIRDHEGVPVYSCSQHWSVWRLRSVCE